VKNYLLLVLVGFAVSAAACSNPSAPSTGKDAQKPATAAATGDGSAAPQAGAGSTSTPVSNSAMVINGPRGDAPGCLAAAALPGVVEWRITNVPAGARIDRGYGHEDAAECGATERSLRTENDHLRFLRDPAEPTTMIVRFDKNTFSCGHTQVDISIDGINVLGEVVNYGEDCTPPEVPRCADCGPVVVVVTPPPPPPLECRTPGVVTNARVYNGVATFTITAANITVSLVGYERDGINFLPQKFIERKVGTFDPGTYTLSVTPKWPHRQEDLYCGEYPEGEDLTEANVAYWDARVIAHDESFLNSRR